MNAQEMRECLENVDWFLPNVRSWAVNPSKYRKHHQGTLYTNAQEARKSLQVVLEDLRKQSLPQKWAIKCVYEMLLCKRLARSFFGR